MGSKAGTGIEGNQQLVRQLEMNMAQLEEHHIKLFEQLQWQFQTWAEKLMYPLTFTAFCSTIKGQCKCLNRTKSGFLDIAALNQIMSGYGTY